jgi:outer membrane protein assembly factor BamA
VLDATRGLFISHSLSTSFRFLGSQQQFVKYYGQYYQYIPLGRKEKIPFREAKQPRLVYAGALRLGLAGGLGGQTLIQSERFFAGGGTTIRGFGQDEVGPTQGGVPVGGNALFILNNELRFPMKWIFDGVGFVDIGNVYGQIKDFNPFSVRKSAGFGIRIYTPYVMLRADYGIKLDRRTGESFGQFFFSIGQAF